MTTSRHLFVLCTALFAFSATAIHAQSDQVRLTEMESLRAAVTLRQESLAAELFQYPEVEAIAASYEGKNATLRIIVNRRAPLSKDLKGRLAGLVSFDAHFNAATGSTLKIVPEKGEPIKALEAYVGGSTSNTAGCFEGTIGAAVEYRSDPQRKGFLTCNHVAAAEGPVLCPNAESSDEVVPGTALTKCHAGLSAGQLFSRIEIGVLPTDRNEVDAAFVVANAVRYDKLRFCPTGEYYLRPLDIPAGLPVRKLGAGSGYKDNGVVSSSDAIINVPYLPCGPTIAFQHQILVEGEQFGVSADSGSLVLDQYGK